MIVYNDKITGDQILSDSYKFEDFEYDGEKIPGIFHVQAKLVQKGGDQIDIGANASAEGGDDEGADDSVETVCNIADSITGFGYSQIQVKAAEFKPIYKGWAKAIAAKIKEEGNKPKDFMTAIKAFFDVVSKEFSNFDIYMTKSNNPESFVIGWWDEEANSVGAPKFIYFREAMISEKY